MSLSSEIPDIFTPENGMSPDVWSASVQSYFLISGLSAAKTNDSMKVAFIISRLGPDALYWYHAVYLKDYAKPEKPDDFLEAITANYKKKEDLFSVRDRLRNLKFQSLDQFLADYLKEAASSPLSQDELIYFFVDRLNGAYSSELRRSPPATLYDAVKVVRTLKAARHPPVSSSFFPSPSSSSNSPSSAPHGGKPWRASQESPSHPVKKIASLTSPSSGSSAIKTVVHFTKKSVEAIVDSGADSSFISPAVVDQLGLHVRPVESSVMMADGSYCKSHGEVTIPALILKERRLMTFTVADIAHDLVLGMPWLQVAAPLIDWKDGSIKPRAV